MVNRLKNINIVLSCSQQAWNKCVIGDSEQEHTFLIAQKVAELLAGYNANVLLIPKLYDTESGTLIEVVRQSNNFINANGRIGYHLDIHTDAGGGRGASAFFLSEAGKGFITQVYKEISNLTPWGDGSVSYRDNLYVLKHTDAVAGLVEVSFHDDKEQAKWIHLNIDNIAKAIVRGLVSTTGLVKVENTEPTTVDPAYKNCVDLVSAKIGLASPEYWTKLKPGEKVPAEYCMRIIEKMANYIYTQTTV